MMNSNHILRIAVVDDDNFFSSMIKERLQMEHDVEVSLFEDAASFLKDLHLNPDICVIDYNLPDKNGLEILKQVKEFREDLACIFLSGQKELNVVVDAYKTGAERYIIKDENAIVELVQNVKALRKNIALKKELESLKEQIIDRNKYQNMIGDSPKMKKMFGLMQKVENVNMPILVTGSNGTGKELVANALHYNSNRKRKSFVAVNVAAIPEDLIESELFGSEKGAYTGASKRVGKFEEANKGTIFLDEIGEMALPLQAKLLRVLQENKVTRLGGNKEINLDIRVISATNKDLWKEVQEGRFREDLYFRLQGFLIHIPSLQERGNDVILLAKHFAKTFCKAQGMPEKSFSSEAFKAMMDYTWPGNVRELKSMVERAVLVSEGEVVNADDLIFLEQFRNVA